MTARGGTTAMAIPPAICKDPKLRAALVAALNRDFRHRRTFATDAGLIWSARVGPYAEPMTLATDNPSQMRELLEDEASSSATALATGRGRG